MVLSVTECTKTRLFELKNREKKFWGGGRPSGGEGTPLLTPYALGAFGASAPGVFIRPLSTTSGSAPGSCKVLASSKPV